MKISTNKRLGQAIVNRGNERRAMATASKRFSLTLKDIRENGVKVSEVKDRLGLTMAFLRLGDKIAQTIKTGMVMCSIDFSDFVNEDNKLGDNAVHVALMYAGLYWKVYDKQTKSLNMELAQEIVSKRKGQEMVNIYETEDEMELINKFNMARRMFGMNNYYLQRAVQALESINEETTLDELRTFQAHFAYVTRALGEQTIDIGKHTYCVYDYTMEELISPYIDVIGSIKKLNSNINTYRKDKVRYEISATEENITNNLRLPRANSVIGYFKQASVDVMEQEMNNYIDILEKETNYDAYKEYEDYVLGEKEFELACLIGSIGDHIMDMTKEDKRRALAAIYHKAEALEIPREDVFKIAMKVAVSDVRVSRDGKVRFIPIIGTDAEYRADIWRIAAIFEDVFVQEYAGTDYLEISVPYEAEEDIPAGIYELTDGYAVDGKLHILSPFQDGKIEVRDNEVVALYDPISKVLEEHPDAIVIPVEGYAKEECKFSNFIKASVSDLEDEEVQVLGFDAIMNCAALRVVNPGNGQYCLIAVNEQKETVAAAKADDSFSHTEKDFLAENATCYKALIVADLK